ncbi:MAG: hypothetical protein A4E53_03520 [Pelotomaculum sp. PtaB.Bin104]|nr:MAG: hypothetical protein A4E53_03520 [Pelotomaculum sp. PtaB.Bin104]
MANRRMLGKSISVSEKVNDLSDFAALLFTWMIPHADDWGILPGSPKKLKALVLPMRRQSAAEVEEALKEIESANLIWWYEADGERYIQFCKWEKHQDIHKRATHPRNPPYPGSFENPRESAGTSGNAPENPGQLNLTEPNSSEPNLIEPVYTVFRHWNDKKIIEHRELTDKLKGHLNARLKTYSVPEICAAIDNYATVLAGEEYFFSYKWSLEEFLTRGNGLPKFVDVSDPLNNYKKHRQPKFEPEPKPEPKLPPKRAKDLFSPEVIEKYRQMPMRRPHA